MPKTLLVADDSVVIQKLVGLSFANEEVELTTTDNGTEALAMARELKPDLVLADVVMPGMSGYELCEAIKQDPELQHIRVLLLTGTFEAFDEARAEQVSADGHITKPFEAQVLVARVNALLDSGNAAPSDAAAAPDSPPPLKGGDYDFFDEVAETPTAPDIKTASFDDDDLQFGDALDAEPPAAGAKGDPLSAPTPNDPIAAAPPSAPEFFSEPIVATPPDAGDATPAPPTTPAQAADPGQTVLAGLDVNTDSEAPAQTAAPVADPDMTMLADFEFATSETPVPADDMLLAEDFSVEASTDTSAGATAPMLDDDLFGEGPANGPASNSFDFGIDEAPLSTTSEMPGTPLASQPIEVGGADLSLDSSDAMPAAPVDQAKFQTRSESAVELPVALEPDAEQSPPQPAPDFVAAEQAAATGSAMDSATAATNDLTPILRERLHETLEKVAWEAFADLSDTIVRQVVEKVEKIAWEVIPQMTELMIEEEIRRMKGDAE